MRWECTVGQFFFASGFASSARFNSGGIVIASTLAYVFHEPDFFACSTAARPAGAITPAFISFARRALLVTDHALFGLRGVKICMWKRSSIDFIRLSIHPKHNASCTASS